MSLEFSLLAGPFYIEIPQGLLGWLGWLALLVVVLSLLFRWKRYNHKWDRTHWTIFLGLLVLTPLVSLFIILRFSAGNGLPPPGRPIDLVGPAALVFASLPWVLSALLLGPLPSAGLAALSGLFLALGDTHNPFTPLEYAFFASLLSASLQQRFRTPVFRALRRPLVSCLFLVPLYPLLYLVNSLFIASGALIDRLDFALTHVMTASAAFGGQLLIAGLFAEVIVFSLPASLKNNGPWVSSPAERRLEARFLYSMAPLTSVLLLLLIGGDWLVAGNAAREMLHSQMASSARTASETVPFFLEAGQNLIQQLSADPRLYTSQTEELNDILAQQLRTVPFFRQLFLLDENGVSVAGYPFASFSHSHPPPEELMGVRFAINGVKIQHYTIRPEEGDSAAQVSFMAAVVDSSDEIRGVLIGRSDLASNPFTKPLLSSIVDITGEDGEGMLIDANGLILYHPDQNRIMETYSGRIADEPLFYDDTAPDGTRQLVYYQPVVGHPWGIVLSVPSRNAHQQALNIAVPLLGMLLIFFVAAVLLTRWALQMVTASLQNLGVEANRIAQGHLDHPLQLNGEDEVGQLRRSFERMRASLKARMDELNRLLKVSQGVASSLEMDEAVKPVLEAALSMGACSARVVLTSAAPQVLEEDNQTRFGFGPFSDIYSSLDAQVLELARKQERLMIKNLSRVRILNVIPGYPRPEALLALALRHENSFYGVLWLGYDQSHQFNEDELRFLSTLAGQAALAAANSQLFQSAEIGRQRLAAILASTPDPILVTDHKNRLLLSNPAAWQVLGLDSDGEDGQLINKITTENELVKLLSSNSSEKQSAEITLPGNRVFLATASTVLADNQRVGRVCVMRDITHFKELDALKSEFVATVSHDLRSPLTLMKGYATMLEMVGDLNDQQMAYIGKILGSVDNITHLVNNLLDLGKIEAGIDLQLEMVQVHQMMEQLVSSVQPQAVQKKIDLYLEIPPHIVPLIEADSAMLQQALQNLIENAIKYTDGGRVCVSLEMRPGALVFIVSDTGIGIAPVDQARLFEKFYRVVHREVRKQHGTGLGLAIVKSIGERHGGKVWVESHLGKGSTFFFQIPLRHVKKEGQLQKYKFS
jgi:PAS domain S-box-containing protein